MKELQLHFLYAFPLDQVQRMACAENGDAEYPSIDEVRSGVERIETLWKEKDAQFNLLAEIAKVTNRVPERNLECFVYGRGLRPLSTPFLLPLLSRAGERTDEKFIDLIIHELFHIFLSTDNRQYWTRVREKYPDESRLCVNHIVLYAMMFDLYERAFETEPIDFSRDDLPPGYARAIELVRQTGAGNIIAEYKALQGG